MHKAIEVIPRSSTSRLVSADEINARFHGDVPRMLRFKCPYCNRPVSDCAMHSPDSRGRGMRAVAPYFRHQKNDPWTANCPEHSTGAGTGGTSIFRDSPSLPIFLRRRPDGMFDIEVSIHPHPAGRVDPRAGDGEAMLDGMAYRPAPEQRLRYRRITLSSPNVGLTGIRVPRHLERIIGHAENGGSILVFSDICGPGGGRRVGRETALHPGRPYYIVANPSALRHLDESFDETIACRPVAGNRSLQVRRVRVSAESSKCDQACRWLYGHGYTLSEIDMSSHPIWPPTLRSSGVDEPLFRNSDVTYKTPYTMTSERDQSVPRGVGYNTAGRKNMRAVSVIGTGRDPVIQSDLDGDCLFVRFGRYQAWNALIATRSGACGLEPAPAEESPAPAAPSGPSSADDGEEYFLEVIDIPPSGGLDRIAAILEEGIEYDGEPSQKVLIRYERKGGLNFMHALLLARDELTVEDGRLRLAPSAPAFAYDFITYDGAVQSRKTAGPSPTVKKVYPRSAYLKPDGKVQIRAEDRLFNQYVEYFMAIHPGRQIEQAANQRDLNRYFGGAVRKDDLQRAKDAVKRYRRRKEKRPGRTRLESCEVLSGILRDCGVTAQTDEGLLDFSKGLSTAIMAYDAILVEDRFAAGIGKALSMFPRGRQADGDANGSPAGRVVIPERRIDDYETLERLLSAKPKDRSLLVIPYGMCSHHLLLDMRTWHRAFCVSTEQLATVRGNARVGTTRTIPATKRIVPPSRMDKARGTLSEYTDGLLERDQLPAPTVEAYVRRLAYGEDGADMWIFPQIFALIRTHRGDSPARLYAFRKSRTQTGEYLEQLLKGY